MSPGSHSLRPDMVLHRLAEFSVTVRSTGETLVRSAEQSCWSGPHALAILDAFSRPVPVAEALATLHSRAAGAQDWIDLTSAVVGLYKAGLLVEPGNLPSENGQKPHGYEKPSIHIKMLNDRVRTERFIAALNEVVRPGDVVVDLGTGTGVLAVAAARAGASRVYALEASDASRFARLLFSNSGMGDRITLLEGWSTRLTLPEKADVLVSEMIGNEPLAERVLETALDARKRLLKPDARLIPSVVRVFGVPASLSPEDRNRWRFTDELAARWTSWYGIDFAPLAKDSQDQPHFAYADAGAVGKYRFLGPPVRLAEIDLGAFSGIEVDEAAVAEMSEDGVLDAIVVFFDIRLSDTVRLSVDPSTVDAHSHWLYPVWLLTDAPEIRRGDQVNVRYRYRSAEGEQSLDVERVT